MLNHLSVPTLRYTVYGAESDKCKMKNVFFTCSGATNSGQDDENNKQFVANVPVHVEKN